MSPTLPSETTAVSKNDMAEIGPPERITELDYRAQFSPFFQLSPGVQFIDHPGYNPDLGPARVAMLRARVANEGKSGPGCVGGEFQGF